ncbi:MAG: hypothetical protein ACW98X_17405 [Promethearchaeota archaeon]
MTKKRLYFIILVSLILLLTASNLAMKTRAHAPEGITLTYNLNTQMLNITIDHEVDDPDAHYVDLIIINVNGSEVLNTAYTNQSSTTGGLYQYTIAANNGSTIQGFARCVEGGSVSACYIVGVGTCPPVGSGIPGYFGIWVIIGFSLIISLFIIHKRIKR